MSNLAITQALLTFFRGHNGMGSAATLDDKEPPTHKKALLHNGALINWTW